MTIVVGLMFFILHYVSCQVCNETRSILREVPETYRFTYIETYEEPCVLFCSVNTRTAVNVTTRIVERYENVTINVCCDGYIEDDTYEGNGLYCKPVCHPNCLNGYCMRPNECACKTGYALDPSDPQVCKPLCLEDCDIPDCISIKTQCHSSNIEEPTPICTESCFNGTCMPSGDCECLPGYLKTVEGECQLISTPNNSDLCLGSCECDMGWQWKPGTCTPVCFGCEFGKCIGPQDCECNYGYIKSDKGKCQPHCSKGCPNGKCVSPEVCSCNPGWYMVSNDGECLPHCNVHCDNGDCVAPNVCVCHLGYVLSRNKGMPRCEPVHKDCEGTISYNCSCELPFMVHHSTDDGSDCDCFVNCSDLERKCTKSFCVYKNEDVDTTSGEVKEKAVKLPDVNVVPLQKLHDSILNLSSTKSISVTDEVNADSNAHTSKKKFKPISTYWICGIVAIPVLMLFLLLGYIIKKKCKTRTLKSADQNNDVIVHYTGSVL